MEYLNVFESKILKTNLFLNRVVDGDGVILNDFSNKSELEIRFLGIDAPEIKSCRKLYQDERETHMVGALLLMLGRMSFNFMKELVLPGTSLTIELEKGNEVDSYGRTLAFVYLPDGRCINEIMITEGYAKPYSRYYCRELTNYQILNIKARNERKGLYGIVDNF
ncbi:MAG: thermonuclease family protein [Paludibacter sp.]